MKADAISGLYAITNGPRQDLIGVCRDALEGGARALQYRDKTVDHARRASEAHALRDLCALYRVPLIVNDDVGLAAAAGAAGVHLGRDDGDIGEARSRLGADAIIGVSCYDSIKYARNAAARNADYVAFGAFFPSPTKPNAPLADRALLRAAASLGIPIVAIGGITAENGGKLLAAGADALAAISYLFDARDVRAAAQAMSALFDANRS